MGTTLANIHILDGDERQIRELLPKATVGKWSDRFISIYSPEFKPGSVEETAKALSRKLSQIVLSAWIFDGDDVGFSVRQDGKTITEHIACTHTGDYIKMGNIPLFCKSLGLPADDEKRIRFLWKKGSAEEKMHLTASLLGLPLYNDYEYPPDKQYLRDSEVVDKWISERPPPPTVRNTTKAEVVQVLLFDGSYISFHGSSYKIGNQLWIPEKGGSLCHYTDLISECFYASRERIIETDNFGRYGKVVNDSARLLPEKYQAKGDSVHFLSDGGLLWQDNLGAFNGVRTYIRCARDGTELWRNDYDCSAYYLFAIQNNEIIFTSEYKKSLERVDSLTGEIIEKMPIPFGINFESKVFYNGCWWITHDGNFKNGTRKGYTLTKFDSTFRTINEIPLPIYTQDIFFSPDRKYVYVFFYKKQVMVINTETLAVENEMINKSFLMPHGFDVEGRFWLQRENNTVEAWDALLSNPLSRHRLNGQISRLYKNEQGIMFAVACNNRKNEVLVYKME